MVFTNNIGKAIVETIKFMDIPVEWVRSSEPQPHQWSGSYQSFNVHMLGRTTTTLFWLNAFPIIWKKVDQYDSKIGHPQIEIKASIFAREDTSLSTQGGFEKIADTSYAKNAVTKTPIELAKWVKKTIENYQPRDDDWREPEPEDAPGPVPVPVLVRR